MKMGQDFTKSEIGGTVPGQPRMALLRDNSRTFGRQDINRVLTLSDNDIRSGRYRTQLYRFLTDNVPAISAAVWTWVRLAAAPGKYRVEGDSSGSTDKRAQDRLDQLWRSGYTSVQGNRVGLASLVPDLFASLFRDGLFGGFILTDGEADSVDRFVPIDAAFVRLDQKSGRSLLVYDDGQRVTRLDSADFYCIPFSAGVNRPLGRSILQPVPTVTYIEQQLVDDMRRSSHNSGYHRLHVKITPPDRMSGEAENAYTDRINSYFDSTVRMIKDCEIDENPVTWDNVEIGHVGPDKSREVSNSWFINHRAMVEEVCAGTNLAPYLLGYSYGATTTWAGFKFDVVMRQVHSVQAEVARFFEWMGNVDLALAGIDRRCRFQFDNAFAYQAKDQVAVNAGEISNLLKLYEAGLIDKSAAQEKAGAFI